MTWQIGLASLMVIALALSLTGCLAPESQVDLVGTYLATYPDGSEELTLAEDGTFLQVVRIDGWDPISSQGKWHYQETGRIILEEGFLLAHQSSGELIQSLEAWRTRRVSLSVTQLPFGTIHLSQSEHYSYDKRD